MDAELDTDALNDDEGLSGVCVSSSLALPEGLKLTDPVVVTLDDEESVSVWLGETFDVAKETLSDKVTELVVDCETVVEVLNDSDTVTLMLPDVVLEGDAEVEREATTVMLKDGHVTLRLAEASFVADCDSE